MKKGDILKYNMDMVRIVNESEIGRAKKVNGELIWSWKAPCNCQIGNTQHSDGGNYHTVLYLYSYSLKDTDIFILLKSDTRVFPSSEKRYVLYENNEEELLLLEMQDWEEILHTEIVKYDEE
jgi:hypothetical protein